MSRSILVPSIQEFAHPEQLSNLPALRVYGWREGGHVIPAYLSIKTPLTLDAYLKITGKDMGFDAAVNFLDNNWCEILQYAKDKGHDGIIFKDNSEDEGACTTYVVFNPEQIVILENHLAAHLTESRSSAGRRLRQK